VRTLTLLCVGKLKDRGHLELEDDYLKRLNPKLNLVEVRAYDDQTEIEAKELLKKIEDQAFVILLTEHGKLRSTTKFHQWFEGLLSTPGGPLVFVIAGAAGPHELIRQRADATLSLSPLTFPHKLARLLLIEQLYRAQTLRQGHPYHK
jgi:23S rRNA (pseudouridine1915-N3)-methyltransferase